MTGKTLWYNSNIRNKRKTQLTSHYIEELIKAIFQFRLYYISKYIYFFQS